jgi:hypothetical protein
MFRFSLRSQSTYPPAACSIPRLDALLGHEYWIYTRLLGWSDYTQKTSTRHTYTPKCTARCPRREGGLTARDIRVSSTSAGKTARASSSALGMGKHTYLVFGSGDNGSLVHVRPLVRRKEQVCRHGRNRIDRNFPLVVTSDFELPPTVSEDVPK